METLIAVGILFFVIIICVRPFLLEGTTKTPKYSGQTPKCPRCGKSNYHTIVEKDIMIPEKTKNQTSLNLNPMKPFTVLNSKEKIVQREVSRNVAKFVCDECGNIWG